MKTNFFRLLISLFLITLLPFHVYAQIATHGLVVKRLRNWAPKYLTVLCNYENVHFENAPSTLRVYSVITDVNGNSTEYMDEEEFHHIIDQPGEVELSYMTKLMGENKSFKVKLIRRKGLYVFDNNGEGQNCLHGYRRYQNYVHPYHECFGTTMIGDEDVDFFEFCTFDYAFGDESERLEKKSVLRKVAKRLEEKGLRNVTESPDIYIYLTLDVDRNIETVYQPIVTSTTNSHVDERFKTDGTGWRNGNFIHYSGNGNGHVNATSTTVTHTSGQTVNYETNDVYLQLSVLDAKKIGNKQIPKVWQMTHMKRHNKTMGAKFFEDVVTIFAKNYPFGTYDNAGHGNVCEYKMFDSGIFIYPYALDAKIVEVLPGSWADQMGIKVGSDVKYKTKSWVPFIAEGVNWLYAHFWDGDYEQYFKIDGKKVKGLRIHSRENPSFRIDFDEE